MTTTLEQTQDLILDCLKAVPAFAGHQVTWVSRKEGKVLNDIDAGRSRLSLACFVYPVAPAGCNPNLQGPVFDKLQLRVTWFENFELNHDASLHADAAALLTLQALHQYGVNADGLHMITVQEQGPMEWSLTKQGLQQWDCWFNCQLSLPQICRTPRPTITYDTATELVTLECKDSDAAIHYTTDGTFPYPENPAVTIYNAPVTYQGVIVTHEDGQVTTDQPFLAASSTEIRAIAIRTGYLPSNLKSITLSSIA